MQNNYFPRFKECKLCFTFTYIIQCIMSGYRSIHREKIGSFPIWKIACSPILSKKRVNVAACWRVWLACGDGNVRGVLIIEKTAEQKDSLDAAACICVLTHVLLGSSSLQQTDSSSSPSETLEQPDSDEEANPPCSVIGCSQLQLARNYVGDDDSAGSMIIASCDLSGKIRIWELPEGMDDELISKIDEISSSGSCSVDHTEIVKEFHVENATGTCIRIMPPNVSGVGDILIAVPCLDGTIALVSTGLSTPKSNKDAKEAGTIVDNWSKKKIHSIALNGEFHPKKNAFAVGRQDGLVEIYENSGERCHRLIQHEAPVRALSFAPDGNLLLTASDDGKFSKVFRLFIEKKLTLTNSCCAS